MRSSFKPSSTTSEGDDDDEEDENEENGSDQQKELESIIKDLEEENTFLIEEYTRLQHQLARNNNNNNNNSKNNRYNTPQGVRRHVINADYVNNNNGSSGSGYHSVRALSSSPTPMQAAQRGGSSSVANYCTFLLANQPNSNGSLNGHHNHNHHNYQNRPTHHQSHQLGSMTLNSYNRVPLLFKSMGSQPTPVSSLTATTATASKCGNTDKESEILKEARLLREHEDKLEARMKILENHNRLLDTQLKQLKSLLNNVRCPLKKFVFRISFDCFCCSF